MGERRTIALEDGSSIELAGSSSLSVDFAADLRRIVLYEGEAYLDLVRDTARPFVVEAAQRRIVADHCNFDVRCDGEKVQVVLIHGEADIHPEAAGSPTTRLRSGEA